MIKNPLVEVLETNKHLRSEAEISAFDKALATIARSPHNSDLAALHSVLTDECQNHEVMYGLVHLLESFDMRSQLAAFLEVLPRITVDAPEWTKILHYRILNEETSRACYKDLFQNASSSTKQVVNSILSKIQQEDPEFSSRIREFLS